MATALDIFRRATRLIGVYSIGETPSTDEANDGLTALNAMIDSFALEKLMLYKIDTISFAPTTQSFTVGLTGQLVTARPVKVLSAYRRRGAIDFPIDVIGREQYESIVLKTQQGPTFGLYYKPDYPNGVVSLWPVPQGDTIFMSVQQGMTKFALTDVVTLPPAYEDFLAFNLAVLIAPEYETEASPTVRGRAMNLKRLIKNINNEIPQLQLDPAMYGKTGHANQWWIPPQ